MNPEPGKQPIADKCADNPDKEVADNSKSSPTNDLAGQPPGDDAN